MNTHIGLFLVYVVNKTYKKIKDKYFLSFTADIYIMTNYVYDSGANQR